MKKVLNKRSNDTSGGYAKSPTTSNLEYGEIAVNYHDGVEKLFIKNDNNQIISFPTDEQVTTSLNGKQDVINDLSTIRSGAAAGASAYQKPSGGIPASDIDLPLEKGTGTNSIQQKGAFNIASGDGSNAEGYGTRAEHQYEHAEGKYNKSNTNTIHSVGIGTDSLRKNAHEIMQNGDHYIYGIGGYDGTNPEVARRVQDALMQGTGVKNIVSLTREEYEALANKDNETIYIVNEIPLSFGGLQISSGPLYYNGNEYAIHEHWNNDSYKSAYGANAGSTYFRFTELGKLFEKEDFTSSDGDIDNLLNPLNNWRLPTIDEWQNIITNTERVGSTVNGRSGCRYSLIKLINVTHAENNTPRGLLIFPDKAIITGRALNGFNSIRMITTDVTNDELEVYLNQGCAFIPCSGYNGGNWRSGGSEGKYLSSSSASYQYNAYILDFNSSQLTISSIYKSDDYSVRLVKPVEPSYKLYKGNNLLIPEPPTPITPEYMTEITWSELKALRDNSQLIPGIQYRITDYVTTTVQENTQSAGHQFDIIVVADDVNKLNENARAILHSGDTYFANSKLEAWELKYCLDNDTTRFAWADTTNGKGVIYRMVDEFNNDCPYDFKNIQFKRKISLSNGYPELDLTDGTDTWVFTFAATSYHITNNTWSGLKDGSLEPPYCHESDESSSTYHDNVIGKYIKLYDDVDEDYTKCGIQYLNDNVFFGHWDEIGSDDPENTSYYYAYCAYGNTFRVNCFSNTFGNSFYNNTFGNYCYSNTFGNSCGRNTFGNYCYYNTFGNGCYDNQFGNSFQYNTFGNDYYDNQFGNYCYYNTFGNYCNDNIFGNECYYNTFGNNCYSNTFGNECQNIKVQKDYVYYIIVENGNKYINITSTQTTSSSNKLMNFTISQGVNNTTTVKTISHDTVNDTFQTVYQPANSQVISV